MSTQSERPAKSPDTDDGTAESQLSARERMQLKRQIQAFRAEADDLAQMQAQFRMTSDADEEAVNQLHQDLLEFLAEAEQERADISVVEISIALWDELSRVESLLRNEAEGGQGPDPSQDRPGETGRPSPVEGGSHQAAPENDPTFQ